MTAQTVILTLPERDELTPKLATFLAARYPGVTLRRVSTSMSADQMSMTLPDPTTPAAEIAIEKAPETTKRLRMSLPLAAERLAELDQILRSALGDRYVSVAIAQKPVSQKEAVRAMTVGHFHGGGVREAGPSSVRGRRTVALDGSALKAAIETGLLAELASIGEVRFIEITQAGREFVEQTLGPSEIEALQDIDPAKSWKILSSMRRQALCALDGTEWTPVDRVDLALAPVAFDGMELRLEHVVLDRLRQDRLCEWRAEDGRRNVSWRLTAAGRDVKALVLRLQDEEAVERERSAAILGYDVKLRDRILDLVSKNAATTVDRLVISLGENVHEIEYFVASLVEEGLLQKELDQLHPAVRVQRKAQTAEPKPMPALSRNAMIVLRALRPGRIYLHGVLSYVGMQNEQPMDARKAHDELEKAGLIELDQVRADTRFLWLSEDGIAVHQPGEGEAVPASVGQIGESAFLETILNLLVEKARPMSSYDMFQVLTKRLMSRARDEIGDWDTFRANIKTLSEGKVLKVFAYEREKGRGAWTIGSVGRRYLQVRKRIISMNEPRGPEPAMGLK